jgi:peptidoglycan/xylan/chitin deacetylase (PgdA/CDA1 family)
MYKYFIKTPWFVKKLFPEYIWNMPVNGYNVYLTFDDGPHPTITPYVLSELKKYNASATFFCIGKHAAEHPDVFKQILSGGHAVGNHTNSHLNGWKTETEKYINDVAIAAKCIQSKLFRPPYGKIKKQQVKKLAHAMKNQQAAVIMWDVLSADFDKRISPEKCLQNVLRNVRPGSIVVFHDSEKALINLKYALPLVLEKLANEGYKFLKIEV